MEPDPGTETGADQLHALNRPREVEVLVDSRGLPRTVRMQRRWRTVERIIDLWRIDDEWWQEHAVSRLYVRLGLEDGRPITLFCDLVERRWWRQAY